MLWHVEQQKMIEKIADVIIRNNLPSLVSTHCILAFML